MRIAMWSGPRNISTTMMYAFAARGDTAVMDEPFYAAYLARTGLDHPMREEIIAAGDTDPARVAATLTARPPAGKAILYQKHMCQHMVPGMPTDWMAETINELGKPLVAVESGTQFVLTSIIASLTSPASEIPWVPVTVSPSFLIVSDHSSPVNALTIAFVIG